MKRDQARDLFHLQTELIDTKVDMAVSRSIDRVIEQISALKTQMHSEIHDLKIDMHNRFSSLDNRIIALETKVGMNSESRKTVRDKILDYLFKSGWAALTLAFSYLIIQFHFLVK